jgi:tetratricopeptide (TPR) repeat protein
VKAGALISATAAIATFSVLGVLEVRMALADYWFRQGTVRGIEKAIRLEPDGAPYYVQLAGLVQESNPPASAQGLQRALALNPRDSQSWIELGLRAEASGNLAGAEPNLLTAARVDRLYFPRWSLANYYFRHDELEKFWRWAREAVNMSYDDLAPLFNLCWRVTSDGELIARELDIREASREASYLTYLTAQNRAEPTTRAAARLLAWNREADVPVLEAACDRLIADDRASDALPIWNTLSEHRKIPYGIIRPDMGQSLTNGDFRALPTSKGFDWRMPGVAGVTLWLQQRPAGLRFTFSGRQPESCELLAQYLAVMEDSKYDLRCRYRTSGIAPGTGLAWRIADPKGTRVLAQGASLAAEADTEDQLAFRTPPGSHLVYLALTYQRALGTTRIEGSITLRNVQVVSERAPRP